jgi:Fe-S oxidoreductase
VIWGEHGKGVRSAYSPEVFGPLYPVLQEVKALFDPHNQLNPGKVATPAGLSAELMPIESPLRAHHDRDLGAEVLEGFAVTVSCNGNAQCLDYHPHHIMCPSSKVTRDRLHSPKGRAMVMRGWLGALSRAGYPLSETEVSEVRPPRLSPLSLLSLLKRATLAPFKELTKRYRALTSQSDISHEVYEAMSGCLSCKACATHCPVKVDVPSLKARFLSLYYERYPRPLRDYAVGALEGLAALGSRAPWLFNALSQNPLTRLINERVIGLVDAPPLSPRSALSALKAEGALMATPERLDALSDDDKKRALVLVPDAFNAFFDAPTFTSAYKTFQALGFTPLIAPFSPNGKGLHVKGRLEAFGRVANKHVQQLAPLAEHGVALVVIEPAVALTYGDEYVRALGELPFEVTLPQTWLSERLELINPQLKGALRDQTPPLSLLGHCTERALAQGAMAQWRALFTHLGAELQVEEVGCCGMCGVFGHEREHQAESMGVYEMSWAPTLSALKKEAREPLATGYSCRSQVKRAVPQEHPPLHPLAWLAQVL